MDDGCVGAVLSHAVHIASVMGLSCHTGGARVPPGLVPLWGGIHMYPAGLLFPQLLSIISGIGKLGDRKYNYPPLCWDPLY